MGEATDARTAGPKARLLPLEFSHLPGWRRDDHAAAFQAFRRGAAVLAEQPPKRRALGIDSNALTAALERAASLPDNLSDRESRAFFETAFQPREVSPDEGKPFFTGYYEPEVAGSLTRTAEFAVPLYAMPDDLVEFDTANPPPGLDPALRFARKTGEGLTEYADRAAIMAGELEGRGLELVWLADPVDAFFIHIQGAARIRLTDGTVIRLTYAAKTGHAYTPIGRVLIKRGALQPGAATMQAIRAWLAEHADEADEVMAANRSYIFFRETPVDEGNSELGPIAAAKVPLTAGRSLAVDRLIHTFHTPVWIETVLPDGTTLRRLMIAQDTGSAIVGAARGDIFFGSGDAAGEIAGEMRAEGRFVVLEPTGKAE